MMFYPSGTSACMVSYLSGPRAAASMLFYFSIRTDLELVWYSFPLDTEPQLVWYCTAGNRTVAFMVSYPSGHRATACIVLYFSTRTYFQLEWYSIHLKTELQAAWCYTLPPEYRAAACMVFYYPLKTGRAITRLICWCINYLADCDENTNISPTFSFSTIYRKAFL
jgi:hypothetical protein